MEHLYPEEEGVLIAYGSIYGNTANAAEILACKLAAAGKKVAVYDVSATDPSYIIAEAFRYSHTVFASSTYNAGIFVNMENLLHELAAHNWQNRTVSLVENGSWAASAGGLMRGLLDGCKNMTLLPTSVTLKSTLREEQLAQLDAIVQEILESMAPAASAAAPSGKKIEQKRAVRHQLRLVCTQHAGRRARQRLHHKTRSCRSPMNPSGSP